MASLTTGQFLAQFAGLPGKATAQGLGVATIHSAVMDPEDESVRRNSLVGAIRADLFEGPESLLVKACKFNWRFAYTFGCIGRKIGTAV